MTAWLSIIGCDESADGNLNASNLALIASAHVIFGAPRLLDKLPETSAEKIAWGSPMTDMIDKVLENKGLPVVVLATGDPTYYGIAATFARHVASDEMHIVPAPSAFSLACARLGWAQQNIHTLSLHGRPVELLHPAIQPGARIVALTSDATTILAIGEIIVGRNFSLSKIWVLERMGSPQERLVETTADQLSSLEFDDFNTVAIECVAGPDAIIRSCVPGLADDAFVHDGQLTKSEVRAATLAALSPFPGALLWDVGAGSGAIGIEWMRACNATRAMAFEQNAKRCEMIVTNSKNLGVPGLVLKQGAAPEILQDAPTPDAIFIGGGLSHDRLFEACWQALVSGGRLVANVATIEGEMQLFELAQKHGGTLTRIAVSRAEPVGKKMGFKPLRTVTQWRVTKPLKDKDL